MKEMQVDDTTLSDLEIFASPDGSGGIFQLIARTKTTIGRTALRRRMAKPLADIGAIRETQNAIRFLQRHPHTLKLDEPQFNAVKRYLNSNIMESDRSHAAARAEEMWMHFRYRSLLKEIEEGVRETLALFQTVQRICTSFSTAAPPPFISELITELTATALAVLHVPEESNALLTVDHVFRSHLRRSIDEALQLLGELDALNSMAAATTELGWKMPDLAESDSFLLEADGVHHPFVKGAITNPIRLTGGEPMVFLTGPNMAGKTTYLRSVALVVLLAQVGMGVPAKRARLTPVEDLFTSLNPADNLRAGLSYFLAEVMRVKEAATILAKGRRALVLFDEVFKGTNVLDAMDASEQVILGFAKARRSGFIFSSHLTQLVDKLRSNRSIRFCCFDGEIVTGAPHFSYSLLDGVSEKRFGLLLLRQAQVPELIAQIGVGG